MSDVQPGAAVDGVLALLVKAVNRGETSDLGISLLVGGSWLIGSMIGGRMWFDQLGQVVDSQAGGEGGSLFRQIGQTAYPSESERLAADRSPSDPEPSFMHLRNARLLTGSAVRVPETGGLIRVRLSSIEGWLIGTLDPRTHRPPPAPSPE